VQHIKLVAKWANSNDKKELNRVSCWEKVSDKENSQRGEKQGIVAGRQNEKYIREKRNCWKTLKECNERQKRILV
jgi:hypothetical protein